MTSPNEPGAPKKGDSLNGDGSVDRAGARRATPAQPGRSQDAADSPPWQRGARRRPASTAPSDRTTHRGAARRAPRRCRRPAEPLHLRHRRTGAGTPPPPKSPPHDVTRAGARRRPTRRGLRQRVARSVRPDSAGPAPQAHARAQSETSNSSGSGRSWPPTTERPAKPGRTAFRCRGEPGARSGPACRSAGSIRGAR